MARQMGQERESLPTRLYRDTVKMLKIVAEWKDLTMAEFVDQMLRKYVKDEMPGLIGGLQDFAKSLDKEPKKGAK